MPRTRSRKRPCRICRRWFLPNPRLKERQKTCGRQKCQRAWHRKKCTQWNRENVDYFKTNYLSKKIEQAKNGSDKQSDHRQGMASSRVKTGLPAAYVQEMIGSDLFIILEYLAHQIDRRRFREARRQSLVATKPNGQQLRCTSSRGDPSLTRCNH